MIIAFNIGVLATPDAITVGERSYRLYPNLVLSVPDRFVRNLFIAAVIGMLAGQAVAGQIYTDRAEFLAAAGSGFELRFENFESAPLGLVPADGIALPAVQIIPRHQNLNQLYIDSGGGMLAVDGTRYVRADVRVTDPVFHFELLFSEPVYSFGAEYNSARSARSLILRDQDGNQLVDLAQDWTGLGTGFFGFTLDNPITSVIFTPGTGEGHLTELFGMDNVVFGVVPEPSAVVLLGLAVTLAARRCRG